jgi:hypothetical protein
MEYAENPSMTLPFLKWAAKVNQTLDISKHLWGVKIGNKSTNFPGLIARSRCLLTCAPKPILLRRLHTPLILGKKHGIGPVFRAVVCHLMTRQTGQNRVEKHSRNFFSKKNKKNLSTQIAVYQKVKSFSYI